MSSGYPPPPGTEIEGTVVGYGYKTSKAQLFLKKYITPQPLQTKSLLSSSRNPSFCFLVKTPATFTPRKPDPPKDPQKSNQASIVDLGEIRLLLSQGAMAELNTLLRVEVAPGKSSGWVGC